MGPMFKRCLFAGSQGTKGFNRTSSWSDCFLSLCWIVVEVLHNSCTTIIFHIVFNLNFWLADGPAEKPMWTSCLVSSWPSLGLTSPDLKKSNLVKGFATSQSVAGMNLLTGVRNPFQNHPPLIFQSLLCQTKQKKEMDERINPRWHRYASVSLTIEAGCCLYDSFSKQLPSFQPHNKSLKEAKLW